MEDRTVVGICSVSKASAGLRAAAHRRRALRAARILRSPARDALAAREPPAAIYARHGITNVGYWIPQESDPELRDAAADIFATCAPPVTRGRDKRLKAAHDDPEFAEADAAGTDPPG